MKIDYTNVKSSTIVNLIMIIELNFIIIISHGVMFLLIQMDIVHLSGVNRNCQLRVSASAAEVWGT